MVAVFVAVTVATDLCARTGVSRFACFVAGAGIRSGGVAGAESTTVFPGGVCRGGASAGAGSSATIASVTGIPRTSAARAGVFAGAPGSSAVRAGVAAVFAAARARASIVLMIQGSDPLCSFFPNSGGEPWLIVSICSFAEGVLQVRGQNFVLLEQREVFSEGRQGKRRGMCFNRKLHPSPS